MLRKVDRSATAFLHGISMLLWFLRRFCPLRQPSLNTSPRTGERRANFREQQVTRASTNSSCTISAFFFFPLKFTCEFQPRIIASFVLAGVTDERYDRTPVRQHSFYLHSQSLLLSENQRPQSIGTVSHSTLDEIQRIDRSSLPSLWTDWSFEFVGSSVRFSITYRWMPPRGSLSRLATFFEVKQAHAKRAKTRCKDKAFVILYYSWKT